MKEPNPTENLRLRFIRSLLDIIILSSLRDKSLHGYLINVVLHKKFGHSFSSSTLYPLLGLLEEEGYVEGVWETKARRKRKIYRITQKGEELLGSSILILDRICRELAVSSAGSKVSQV